VHAYQAPHASITEAGLGAAGGMPVPAVFTEDREQVRLAAETQAKNLIEEALRRAGAQSANGLQIERIPVEGPAAKILIESAKGADMLVIGSHGHGGLRALILGSVSHRCAENPPCPLVITPCP
jgi:nucleotide-binding universal stress UspA family protein